MTAPFAATLPGADLDAHQLTVNGVDTTLRAALALDRHEISIIAIVGCHAIVSLDLPAAVSVSIKGCCNLINVSAPAAALIVLDDCPGVRSLDAPQADRVVIEQCPNMVTLTAPVATLAEIIHSDQLWSGDACVVEKRHRDDVWTGRGVYAPAAEIEVTCSSIDFIRSSMSRRQKSSREPS
jgi:hypothetical protein